MESSDSLAKAIKALTVAVWFLCVLILVQVAFYVWGYVEARSFNARSKQQFGETGSALHYSASDENDFPAFPPEEKIRRSSMILVTKFQKQDGKLTAIIVEIIEKTPNTRFYIAVGDEYPELGRVERSGEACGEGDVVFLTGNPAMMRESYSYSQGRIDGLGQMPLATPRELAKKTPQKTAT